MTGAMDRETILGRIRRVSESYRDDPARGEIFRQRIADRPRSVLPARAQLRGMARLSVLEKRLRDNGATVSRASAAEQIVTQIRSVLREHGPRLRLVTGADPVFADLPWSVASDIERRIVTAAGSDVPSLVYAPAAAAETGTLFVMSGPDNPTTLNFLPDFAIVLLRTSDVLASYEDAFDRLRALCGADWPPRAINLIGGPSRTADIEQTIVFGAHGPRALHVLLWKDGSSGAKSGPRKGSAQYR